MGKSKKSSCCGCLSALFSSRSKVDSKDKQQEAASQTERVYSLNKVEPEDHIIITERKVQTDINFYNPNKQSFNNLLPGQPIHYKTTIVTSHSYPQKSSSFRLSNLNAENDSIRKSTEINAHTSRDPRNYTSEHSELGDSIYTPIDHIPYGLKFTLIPNDASTSRPLSQSNVPDLFENSRLKKNTSGLLPHLMPVTPIHNKRYTSHASMGDSSSIGNILDELKKELEQEDKLMCNNEN
ncbi:unnamed protein product [Blepharisma stoltei]|uniref:Uncharacterized protein n=1 Tax=Blepharisma stoltei TaxID=1481888 RepID=A0AAU9ITU0_9CILI|nr:unnamed protein product [Blepharisma stoltei]